MERRIGTVLILIEKNEEISTLNQVISNHSSIILGRQGLPSKQNHAGIISLVLEGTTDEIGSLTGQLGRLNGIRVKSAVIKLSE